MDTLAERPNGAKAKKEKKERVYLGQDNTFKLADLLLRHGQVHEHDGIYYYNQAWNDERVHAEIGDPRISVKRIAYLRRKNFGPLTGEVKAKPMKKAQIVQRLAELEARVEMLEKVVAS